MSLIEFSWTEDYSTLKDALKSLNGSSGQLIKKHFSSKELIREVRVKDRQRVPLNFINHLKINPVYLGPEVFVLAETPDYLVLHKPPGVHSHPLCYSDTDTLLNFLASKNIWEPLLINEAHYDRGLLYRLDFETSGVMVIAKSEEFLSIMRKDFSTLVKKKFYWAVVEGSFNQEGQWTHFFKASGALGSKQKVFSEATEGALEGSLSVVKLLEHQGKSLLLVSLKTGLRHQIRAELAHLGFPILGDELYGGEKNERLFLHALRYEFSSNVSDHNAELFDVFFDLDRALQVSHDMFRQI